ncbi:hypothetical protein IY145_04470 [Methylosinus sp. H3A]|uniref:hypothetical protein n=1 Tax=Methylosinus sp. H3A TaxID=2785786 RepID=UPI0018C32AFE|nr:hypothetical protein [Methylosinus sp. H3A]MBG0808624.1 hypothetical protein [Methylosinus sp. H3A]
MHPINELKQLREQMIEQLTQIPEYQALKAMERFIGELSSIYESSSAPAQNDGPLHKPTVAALDNRHKSDLGASSPRVTPYIPAHRVA